MEEAIEVIRLLWEGSLSSHHGKHYTVENARLYTLPDEPPPIMIATAGERATKIAAEIGDGMYGLVPDSSVVEQFNEAGGQGKPKIGQVHVCWAGTEDKARKTALEWWPNAVAGGNLPWEMPLPSLFEAATEWADEDDIAEEIVCTAEAGPLVEAIEEFVDAGYDHVYFHQVGPEQESFLEFSESELLPALDRLRT